MISNELENRILEIAQEIIQENMLVYMGIIPIDEIRNQTIKMAQQITQEKGLKVGDQVAYLINDFAYELYELIDISVLESTAIIWISANKSKDRKERIKKVFLSELFDATIVKEVANHFIKIVDSMTR